MNFATFFCFFSLVAYLFKEKEKKPRKFSVCVALGIFWMLYLCYSIYLFIRMNVKRPRVVESIARKIYFIIGQSAVNAATHHQPAILQDFLPCVFSALGNHLKNSLENVPYPYSVNILLHNLKIQPLTICIPLAPHWTVCGV